MSGKVKAWNHSPNGCEINAMTFDIQLSLLWIVQMINYVNACEWITHHLHVSEIKRKIKHLL